MELPPSLHNLKYFFLVYKYIHCYLSNNDDDVLSCSKSSHIQVLPTIYALSDVYNEIFWKDRLDLFNHIPHFPSSVTDIVDTLSIYVQQLTNSTLRSMLYNPKYAATIYKIQFEIDFLECIILFSRPHLGV